MAEQKVQQILALAVKAVKEGDKDKARHAFLTAIKLDSDNETAWLGLVSVAKDNRERLTALKQVLIRNPNNSRALAVLEKLGIPPERLIGDSAPSPEEAPPPLSAQPAMPKMPAFADAPPEPEPEPEPIEEPTPAPAFELPTFVLGTEVGVPVANPQILGQVMEDVEQLVNDYINDEYAFENVTWVR